MGWLLLLCMVLAACTTPRPASPPDALDCDLQQFVVTDAFSGWQVYRASLSTHAFLGLDAEIEALYRDASGPQIYRSRSVLDLLSANSLLDATGKDQLIQSALTAEMIDRVAAAPEGRFLYLGVVDLDSGRFMRIDMVKLAKTLPQGRRDACYRGVVSASSAIPIAFPPRFIDGMMLTDGGARRHLFLTEVPADALKRNVTRRMFSFVHGDLDVGCATTGNGLLPITSRALELFSDQSFKDAIALSAARAAGPVSPENPERLFHTSLYAAADRAAVACAPELAACTTSSGTLSEDLFCQPFMRCLADRGKEEGRASALSGQAWRTLDSLNLGSTPSCHSPQRGLNRR